MALLSKTMRETFPLPDSWPFETFLPTKEVLTESKVSSSCFSLNIQIYLERDSGEQSMDFLKIHG